MSETTIEKLLEDQAGTVILSLTQPQPWDEPTIMAKLQERLNGYASVIESGVLVKKFPHYIGRNFQIRVVFYHDLPEAAHQNLTQIEQALATKGIGLHLMQIKVEAGRRDRLKEGIVSLMNR